VLRRGLIRATDFLLPLAAAAGALALVAPSAVVAERSDVVLAALVLFTALTIAPSDLAQLRACKAEVTALVVAPFTLLVPLAWVASRPFDGAVSDGVLALGAASTEVAAVGMVALAGGRAALPARRCLACSPEPATSRSASSSAASLWWSSCRSPAACRSEPRCPACATPRTSWAGSRP
jgi:hypothetical protein